MGAGGSGDSASSINGSTAEGAASGLQAEDVAKIEAYMRHLSEQKIPFIRKAIDLKRAIDIFNSSDRQDLYNAIKERGKPYVIFYDFDGLLDYFYGYMAPHSGYIDKFSLIYHPPGLVAVHPTKTSPGKIPSFKQLPKLMAIFSEYSGWGKILGVENVGALNELVGNSEGSDLIRIAEALQEKKIAQIADMITGNSCCKRIVFISGPSSSGKTTFANRLSIQLRVNGFKTHAISMDDYFLNRGDTPLDENGEYDFESPKALDIDLFVTQMRSLAAGETVDIPVYSFIKGMRESYTRTVKADDNHIIIVEGIHGLNTMITSHIHKVDRFKIYISALTALNIDDHNRIPTTDTRLIRRIVRDNQFRGSTALDTIKRWPSVRMGEKKYIFPYQETCDIMFNSALIYELGILRAYAMPLLKKIRPDCMQYPEANRLVKFLSCFAKIDSTDVPQNSILREFIGGSCFNV